MCMEELELEPEKARAFIGNDVELLRNTLYQDQYIYMAVQYNFQFTSIQTYKLLTIKLPYSMIL